MSAFHDGIHHWNLEHKERNYKRYSPEQYTKIADNFVAYQNEGNHNSTENLVVYVPVQMFHQLPVGESGVCLQDHKGDLCGRTEYVPAAQASVRQACGFCHTFKRKDRMKLAKLTLIKTLAVFFQNIKFCKTQSRVNF